MYITYIYIHLYVLSQWLVVLKKGVHMCCPLYEQFFHSYLISSEYIHCCERYCMLLHQMAVPWRPSIPTPSVHTYRFGKLLRLFLQAFDHLPYRVRKLKAGCGRALVPDYLSLMNVSSSSDGVSAYLCACFFLCQCVPWHS